MNNHHGSILDQSAVRSNNIEAIKKSLEAGADPNSGLAEACSWNRLEMVELLLKSGADPNRIFEKGKHPNSWVTPISCSLGHLIPMDKTRMFWKPNPETVRLLLKHGADPNLGRPLLHAMGSPSWDLLVEAGAVVDEEVARDGLICAVGRGDMGKLTIFFHISQDTADLKKPLAVAAASHRKNVIRWLAEHGADLNSRHITENPLACCLKHTSTDGNHLAIFQLLKDLGAQLDKDIARMCLYRAANNRFINLNDFRFLLDEGVQPAERQGSRAGTLLDSFLLPRHQSFLEFLLGAGYVTPQDVAGARLVRKVLGTGQYSIMDETFHSLVDQHVILQRDLDRCLEAAMLNGNTIAAKELVGIGANPCLKMRFGFNVDGSPKFGPLIFNAVTTLPGSRDLVKTLLSAGALDLLKAEDLEFLYKRAEANNMSDLFEGHKQEKSAD